MKKNITIEIDTDELKKALESSNNVALKLTIESTTTTTEQEYTIDPELPAEVKKKLNWPF